MSNHRALGHVSLTVHAAQAGSTASEWAGGANSLCVHTNADRTVVGTFTGTTTFGSTTSLTAEGGVKNVFVLTTNANVCYPAVELGAFAKPLLVLTS